MLEPLLAGLVLIALFVIRALHIERPLLDVRLFANRAFAAASLTTFCLGAALFGAMILMPLYFQTVRGEDAVHTGLLLAPQGIGAAIAMALSARVTERFGGGLTALGGGIITILATIPFVIIGGSTSYWLIGAAMVVRGFGIGMSMMPAMTAAFSVLRPEQVNHATPQLTVLQRVGGSIGTAILSVVLQCQIDGIAGRPTADTLAAALRQHLLVGHGRDARGPRPDRDPRGDRTARARRRRARPRSSSRRRPPRSRPRREHRAPRLPLPTRATSSSTRLALRSASCSGPSGGCGGATSTAPTASPTPRSERCSCSAASARPRQARSPGRPSSAPPA